MDSRAALRLAEGDLAELVEGERALAALCRKSVLAPARLGPADLRDVVGHYGRRGAFEITATLASFHFINRIADLVGIQSDLPIVQPRFAWLRHAGVRFQGWAMGRLLSVENIDMDARIDVEACLAEAESVLGPLPPGFRALHEAPNVAAFLTSVSAVARHLDRAMVDRVAHAVAEALPSCAEEATGFHAHPGDPFDALVFVATRQPARTGDALVDRVREKYGYDDAGLTDLFYAISMRNAFERTDRLMARPLVS